MFEFFFETKEQKHQRIYNQAIRGTRTAIRQLERESAKLLRLVAQEKTRAKREYKTVGVMAVRECARNIVMLQKQLEKTVWMKGRVEVILSETRLVHGQLALFNTMHMLCRSMAILNSDENFRETIIQFERNVADLQCKQELLSGAFEFSEEDFCEEEEQVLESVLDGIVLDITGEIPAPSSSTIDAQLEQLPDASLLSLEHRRQQLVE